MRIIYWIYIHIIKADFTPSFKVGNFNFLEPTAAIVSTNYWISISCWLKGRKVGEVGCGGGEGCGFNVFNFYKLQKHVRFFWHTFIHKTKFTLIDDVKWILMAVSFWWLDCLFCKICSKKSEVLATLWGCVGVI